MGGIATSKSTVSALLHNKGVPIIDADIIARKVIEPGTTGLKQIFKYFGEEVLSADGSLDCKKLGSVIFSDESKRKRLNAILHPAIHRMMVWEVVKHWFCGWKYCVLDMLLLIEGPIWKWVSQVTVVYCPEEIQLERLMQHDGSTREDASARLSSQLPISNKVKYADIVIDNLSTRENLEGQVTVFVQELEKADGWTWVLSWLVLPYGVLSAAWILVRHVISRKTKDKTN
ncbi:CoaE-domain-containing protein [Armillaria mellea]|nr:CoaE-domain-containing protein [Armillaria mellea]